MSTTPQQTDANALEIERLRRENGQLRARVDRLEELRRQAAAGNNVAKLALECDPGREIGELRQDPARLEELRRKAAAGDNVAKMALECQPGRS